MDGTGSGNAFITSRMHGSGQERGGLGLDSPRASTSGAMDAMDATSSMPRARPGTEELTDALNPGLGSGHVQDED